MGVEMFGDDEEEPTARSNVWNSNTVPKAETVLYADPSELRIIPTNITDRMDYHWDELQSSEAAKFLTAYGSEGSFLVRTRPGTNSETALAVMVSGVVHHFKCEMAPDGVCIGGVKRKTIPMLIAYFQKAAIYKGSTLKEPLPPYIDIIKKLEALGYESPAATKAFKATRSYESHVLVKYIKDNNL